MELNEQTATRSVIRVIFNTVKETEMQEFKVGDNVQLEGTITDMWKSHVYVQLKGDAETVCVESC